MRGHRPLRSSEDGEDFWGPSTYKGEEQTLNLTNAALALP